MRACAVVPEGAVARRLNLRPEPKAFEHAPSRCAADAVIAADGRASQRRRHHHQGRDRLPPSVDVEARARMRTVELVRWIARQRPVMLAVEAREHLNLEIAALEAVAGLDRRHYVGTP